MLKELLPNVEVKDWGKILTPDCTLVIDPDTLAFDASSVCEERKVLVKRKGKDWEKVFKNKSEFKGRARSEAKMKEGDFLYDWNVYRESINKPPLHWDDFEIETVQELKLDIDMCYRILDKSINAISSHLGVKNVLLLVQDPKVEEFRLKLPLHTKYKGNRDGMSKPLYLSETKAYLRKKPNTHVVHASYEADDGISMFGYLGYKNYLKTGKFNYIVATLDKDAYQTPSLLFHYQRSEGFFSYDKPFLIPDLTESVGGLEFKGSDCKGYGFKWLCKQLLTGDWTTDGFSPYHSMGFKRGSFGEKTCYDLLHDKNTPEDLLIAVRDQYLKWFPDGEVRYTSWNNKDMKLHWIDYAEMIFKCAYMRRRPNDPTKLVDLYNRFGVSYET